MQVLDVEVLALRRLQPLPGRKDLFAEIHDVGEELVFVVLRMQLEGMGRVVRPNRRSWLGRRQLHQSCHGHLRPLG